MLSQPGFVLDVIRNVSSRALNVAQTSEPFFRIGTKTFQLSSDVCSASSVQAISITSVDLISLTLERRPLNRKFEPVSLYRRLLDLALAFQSHRDNMVGQQPVNGIGDRSLNLARTKMRSGSQYAFQTSARPTDQLFAEPRPPYRTLYR